MSDHFGQFDCRLHVSGRGTIKPLLRRISHPRRVAILTPVAYERLLDPSLRQLMAAFDRLPRTI